MHELCLNELSVVNKNEKMKKQTSSPHLLLIFSLEEAGLF